MTIKRPQGLKFFFAFSICLLFSLVSFAQTVSISAIDLGPYTAGSTIAVRLNLDYTSSSFPKDNVFELWLSDANGSFGAEKKIGTYNGFGINGSYATFINGIIPTDATPGTYAVRVKSTKPATVSAASATFNITSGDAVKAGVNSTPLNPSYPEVYGNCNSDDNINYTFTNASANASQVSLTFFNDLSGGTNENSGTFSSNFYNFKARAANYTVFVKAVGPTGTVATKAYLLLNNIQRATFGTISDGPVCLVNGVAVSSCITDIASSTGIQYNFPGTLYTIKWGDGTNNVYTFAEIKAKNGIFTHTYSSSSCGLKDGQTVTNSFKVTLTASNTFCPSSAEIGTYQAILQPPTNSITGPATTCTNTATIFTNSSFPGQSASSKTSNCSDPNVLYSWFVDGVQQAANLKVTDKFSYTFTTNGSHTVAVRLQNSASGCYPQDFVHTICVQDPPTVKFTLDKNTICAPDQVAATDNTVLDNTCTNNYVYNWTVTPATGVSFVNGTNKNSKAPVFKFTTEGAYTIQLQIISPTNTCITKTYSDIVYVNAAPKAALSPDFASCGKGQTLTFDNTANSKTKVTFSGTSQVQADTYTWTVTAPAGAGAAQFVNNTNANSQYPAILFPDFGKYTITVAQKNACGITSVATQNINFQDAPTVNAGPDVLICPGNTVNLNATVSDMTNISGAPTWSGGTAAGFSDIHAYNPVYTPTAAEIQAGSVTLTISVPTKLAGNCNIITSSIKISIRPVNNITSAATKSICSGTPLAYQITSSVPNSTFTWTATGSNNASGFATSGSGNITEPNVANSSAVNPATITYTIVPHADGCDGNPFTLTVNIVPKPVIKATAPAQICSGQPANIALSSNVTDTKYTWTATSTFTQLTGFNSSATPTTSSTIADVLVNNGTVPATVTYVISSNGGADDCAGNTETVTITVQPKTPVANAGADKKLCGAANVQLEGNDLGAGGQGLWTLQSGQTGITFDDATKFNTNVNGLKEGQIYTFRWSSKGIAPCGDNYDEVIIRNEIAVVKADFKVDKASGCDPLTVQFSNNSSDGDGISYMWDFGNGVTSTLRNPAAQVFSAQSNGKDSIYVVKLTVTNGCSFATTTGTIRVQSKTPVARIAPDKTTGCIPFVVNIENISPGTNDQYTYYLLNSAGTVIAQKIRTDKEAQPFTINTPGTYQVYMTAQTQCGAASTLKYQLVVAPGNIVTRLTVDGTQTRGCSPLTVTFHNGTTGASLFRYEWNDGTPPLTTTSTDDVTHTFAKGGDYNVVMHAANSCVTDAPSAPIAIHVNYAPVVAFKADVTTGCKRLTVHFTNNTTDQSVSQQSDLRFDWDFGDGSEHSGEINPVHHYTTFQGSPFTVTLTVTNGTGCTTQLVMPGLITINSSSLTDFTVRPDSVIEIPNYKFSFIDRTTNNPISWRWDFGDHSAVSSERNPDHTYADTGLYKVTLTTTNQFCDSTKVHYVRVKGVPGQLFMPNAMMPNSLTPTVRTFTIKGSGLKDYHLQIFDNYGRVIFETSKLSEKGEPLEAWDGTFKGSPVPQGVYIWQATATFINGNEWRGMSYNGGAPKRTGVIHLLR
ncbi:PKD domain-containing protein [Mucilaginibacter sp. RS28]|uniref:PKD domain-containing protein n=1 Tax=Mucilaginibacter straminoryzae TaxID=2932774 RepID=A0A9X1X8B4_9SPHI|nr:PKD domain-containing protein [Mucilaginibacter straminoryzae]MCJ8211543.1 PKD domain-containing protein [Mucilaginibacter straminoryzae]